MAHEAQSRRLVPSRHPTTLISVVKRWQSAHGHPGKDGPSSRSTGVSSRTNPWLRRLMVAKHRGHLIVATFVVAFADECRKSQPAQEISTSSPSVVSNFAQIHVRRSADSRNRAHFQGKASQPPPPKMLFCSCLRSAEPPETGSFRPSGAGPPGPEGFPLVNARVVDGDGVIQAAGKSSSVTGGAWARRVGRSSARKPRCSRIFFATLGSSMQAMSRILP